jgi:hypothetical protein
LWKRQNGKGKKMAWIELSVYAFTISGLSWALWHERKVRRANSRFLAEQLIEVVKIVNAQTEVNKNQEEINILTADNWELVAVHSGLLEPSVTLQAQVFLAEQEIENKKGEENG